MQAINRSIRRDRNTISKSPITIIQGQPFWIWNWPSKKETVYKYNHNDEKFEILFLKKSWIMTGHDHAFDGN